jgi:drug/metabolite transporter (DMT)-like permease
MTAAAGVSAGSGTRLAFGQLAVVVVLFGVSWPVMKLGLANGATPIWFAAGRADLGAVASFALVLSLRRLRLPAPSDLPIIASIGVLQLSAFFVLINLGLRLVSAGRSAVLAYTTSLWLVPLAALAGERIGGRRMVGVALGLAGIVVLIDPLAIDATGEVLAGYGFLLTAALCWALAILHSRRHAWRLSPLQALPWQMLVAAILLTGLAAAIEPQGRMAPSSPAVLALLYLGVLAGPVATWAATSVARALPMLVSSIGFLGTPVVGIVLATLWLNEPLSATLLLGASLVLVGVAVVVSSATPK